MTTTIFAVAATVAASAATVTTTMTTAFVVNETTTTPTSLYSLYRPYYLFCVPSRKELIVLFEVIKLSFC